MLEMARQPLTCIHSSDLKRDTSHYKAPICWLYEQYRLALKILKRDPSRDFIPFEEVRAPFQLMADSRALIDGVIPAR